MRSRLHLDFVRPRAPRTWLGAGLLAAGVVASAAALLEYRVLADEVSRLEARVADTQRMARRDLPRLRQTSLDPKTLADEVRNANVVLAQLTIPWGALFREIEAAANPSVALLSIQPDAASRAVRIAGEARRFEDVLAYVERLEVDALANVFLTSPRWSATRRGWSVRRSAQWVEGEGKQEAGNGTRNGDGTPE
jgi:hypothetical protein